jgi:hypothetical protein
MSTKNSLAYGPGFHLYQELFDDNNIYLEMEGTRFEAAYNRIMVPIPVHIWEVIRRVASVSFDYADKSDAEIRDEVNRDVNARLKQYAEASENGKRLDALSGPLLFGPIDASREEQVAKGIAHFTQIREHQRQIRIAIV